MNQESTASLRLLTFYHPWYSIEVLIITLVIFMSNILNDEINCSA